MENKELKITNIYRETYKVWERSYIGFLITEKKFNKGDMVWFFEGLNKTHEGLILDYKKIGEENFEYKIQLEENSVTFNYTINKYENIFISAIFNSFKEAEYHAIDVLSKSFSRQFGLIRDYFSQFKKDLN